MEEFDDAVRVTRSGPLKKINLKTLPHPGFPTDLQPQMAVMLSVAEGTSIITEGVWDNRYKYVDELRRMGAKIQVDGKVAVVEGVESLTGAPVKATDLRAGAALIIAGLIACGQTEVEETAILNGVMSVLWKNSADWAPEWKRWRCRTQTCSGRSDRLKRFRLWPMARADFF